jgi:hypothetical protein
MRLLLHAAAYILHQQLRTQVLQHTGLSQAQPSTVINKLFKIAVQVRQTKQRIVLHLPSACAVKNLLHTLTERLFVSASEDRQLFLTSVRPVSRESTSRPAPLHPFTSQP